MSPRSAALLVLVNAILSALILIGYAIWHAPATPSLAVLDVGELYRLKEAQVAKLLVSMDASAADRALALTNASAFGLELDKLLQALPEECRCLILARGAVLGPPQSLPDLTPDVRRRLGL